MINLTIPVKIYDLLILLTSNLRSILLLALRVTWGRQFMIDGHGKVTHLDNVTSYFKDDLHIPLPQLNAFAVSWTELIGGAFLLVGVAGRFWATVLTVVMTVAFITAEPEKLHAIDDFVQATAFPYLFASVVLMVFGPGRFSVDFLIQHFVLKRPDRTLA